MNGATDPRIRWQRTVAAADDLPRSTRHIAVFVACHLNAQLLGGVALAVLVSESGYSRDTVLRALKRLKAGGWLRVAQARRRGRATVYQADVPALFARNEVAELLPEQPYEVAPALPHPLPRPVDRADEVAPLPPRPLVQVAPALPQQPNEVAPVPPLFKDKELLLGGHPVDDGGASRPPASSSDVEVVMAALDEGMRPRDEAQATAYRHLIRQRLEHRPLLEVVTAAAHIHPTGHVNNPPALFASKVPVLPRHEVAAPPPHERRCAVHGHEHAVVTAAGCSACRFEALGATS